MSADHLQFLKNKFILDLEDAEEEHSGENEIPLLAHFLQIRDVLEAKDITESTPIRLKNCLYDAISALEGCVVLSEKREPRKKKDGPMHGYTLAEHWLLCKTRRLLVQIRRKLTATSDAVFPGMTDMAASSSSTSLPLIPRPNPGNFHRSDFPGFDEQLNTILDRLGNTGKGFQEIGIVGIGGSGKTTLAKLVFTERQWSYFRDYRIWICLFPKLSGDVDFEEMMKDILKQCEEAAVVDDGVEVEELLERLGKALKGKRYLMVFDGIWEINIDWYFKLKEKLKSVSGESGDGHVIITSRLPHKARMMVGPHNLYQMQPPSSMEELWQINNGLEVKALQIYRSKLMDEVIERCDGLPLTVNILAAVIEQQILGWRFFYWRQSYPFLILINCEDDAMLGNELLSSCRTILLDPNMGIDVSKLLLHDKFNAISNNFNQFINSRGPQLTKIIIWSGDAMANQLMQLIMLVARNLKLASNPPILLFPLGSKAHISFSLGWDNQPSGTLPKDIQELLQSAIAKPRKSIDSWRVVMKLKSIPEGFQLPSTFRVESALKANMQPTEGDKEFHATFWNYFIIGLDAEEFLQNKDECCGSYFKRWPRNIVLPICIKAKDQQGEWKEIHIPHSTRSIVCLNLPYFRDRPNVKEKYRNFKDSFVDDELLEVICFRDAWHGDDFLPSKDHGKCLAEVGTIRLEFYNSVISHIHMSIDGNRWKHPLPIEDDNQVIEIYYSRKTRMLVNHNSKCKFK